MSFSLSFQTSPDFSKYGFNNTIGSPGSNPDIMVHSGDTVTMNLSNPSKSFHAFGIVVNPEDPSAVLWNSAFKTPDSPMKPGETGQVTLWLEPLDSITTSVPSQDTRSLAWMATLLWKNNCINLHNSWFC